MNTCSSRKYFCEAIKETMKTRRMKNDKNYLSSKVKALLKYCTLGYVFGELYYYYNYFDKSDKNSVYFYDRYFEVKKEVIEASSKI